jgi:hypothetical protein
MSLLEKYKKKSKEHEHFPEHFIRQQLQSIHAKQTFAFVKQKNVNSAE